MFLIKLEQLTRLMQKFNEYLTNKFALKDHGNHVPNKQTANNAKFLRNDNTWQTIVPKNIGAAASQTMTGSAMSTSMTWYRIAQSPSGINNDFGCIDIMATGSNTRSITRLMAAISFGKNPIIQQLAHSTYSATAISKARIVYTEEYSKNRAYLEVYAPHTETLTMSINMVEGLNWTLLSPGTKGEIPEGYTSIEIDLVPGGVIVDSIQEDNPGTTEPITLEPLTIQLNNGAEEGVNKFTYDGSENKTLNITSDVLGIDIPEPKEMQLLTIRLNGGTTEGVDNFIYNGDEEIIMNITPDLLGLDGTVGENAHTHTSLSNVSRIDFAAQDSDTLYMKSTIDGDATYLDFYIEDDSNQDRFRWLAGVWGGWENNTTEQFTMMTLTPASSSEARLTLFGDANATAFNTTGADYAEYFEWEDGNLDNEDRRGYFVTMIGNKIKLASENDYILGIISSCPAIVGNSDLEWRKKYLLDEYGSPIKINNNLVLNPDYDPNIEYIPRSDRTEWDIVGMMGVLAVNDDGTCEVNGYCKCNNQGIATAAEKGNDSYRIVERVTDNIIKIILK